MNNGWVLLQNPVISNMTTINLNSLMSDEYKMYKVIITDLSVASNAGLLCRFGNNGIYGNYGYQYQISHVDCTQDIWKGSAGSGTQTYIGLIIDEIYVDGTYEPGFEITFVRNNEGRISMWWDGIYTNSSAHITRTCGMGSCSLTHQDSIQFLTLNGTQGLMTASVQAYGLSLLGEI